MRLIRFKQNLPLFFVTPTGSNTFQKDFHDGELAEFALQDNGGLCWTLTTADGSYAPFVGKDVLDILPEGFELYRFTQNTYLSSGFYSHGRWVFDIGSTPYMIGSLHAFKIVDEPSPSTTRHCHLATLNGNIIPEVPRSAIERVAESPTLPTQSPKKSKKVLEAFPAPVPGEKGIHDGAWSCPYAFNSLRVIRDHGVPSSLLDCSESPVAYLRLEKNVYGSYIYCCSFFGVPPAGKLAKA